MRVEKPVILIAIFGDIIRFWCYFRWFHSYFRNFSHNLFTGAFYRADPLPCPYDSGGIVPWAGVGVPQKMTSIVGIGHAVCRESTFWIPACAGMTFGDDVLRGGGLPASPFVIPAQAGIQKDPWRPYLTKRRLLVDLQHSGSAVRPCSFDVA